MEQLFQLVLSRLKQLNLILNGVQLKIDLKIFMPLTIITLMSDLNEFKIVILSSFYY